MTNVLQQLEIYLSYPFVRYAIVVTVFIAFCSCFLFSKKRGEKHIPLENEIERN